MSNVSRVGIIVTSTLPCRSSLSKHWCQCVVGNLVTSYPKCDSSVVMCTWVLNTPHFIGVGRDIVCYFWFSGVWGKLCTSWSKLPSPTDWSLLVWLGSPMCQELDTACSVSVFPSCLTTWEWLEETVGTLVARQLLDCHTYPVLWTHINGLKTQSLSVSSV